MVQEALDSTGPRPHHRRHRPSALHRPPCRLNRGHGSRTDRRDRYVCVVRLAANGPYAERIEPSSGRAGLEASLPPGSGSGQGRLALPPWARPSCGPAVKPAIHWEAPRGHSKAGPPGWAGGPFSPLRRTTPRAAAAGARAALPGPRRPETPVSRCAAFRSAGTIPAGSSRFHPAARSPPSAPGPGTPGTRSEARRSSGRSRR